MAKDRLGNELEVGDLVQLTLDGPIVYGHVTKIHNGGVVVPGGQDLRKHAEQTLVTAGVVEVVIEGAGQFDPRDGRAPGIVKCIDPEKAGKKTGLLQSKHLVQ